MWVVYALGCAVLLSLSVIFAKCGSKRADASIITSLRTLVIVIYMWITLFASDLVGHISSVGGTEFLYIIICGILLAAGLIFYHISLKYGSVTGVTALEKVTTLLMILVNIFVYELTSVMYIRIICIVLLALGIFLIVSKAKRSNYGKWLLYGILAGVAAVCTIVLRQTEISVSSSNLGLTLILTAALVASLISVFVRGLQKGIGRVPASEFMFIILSGIAAGGAWFCYNQAMSGDQTAVTAIVGMSILSSAGLSALFLKEKVSWKAICGLLLISVAILMYEFIV